MNFSALNEPTCQKWRVLNESKSFTYVGFAPPKRLFWRGLGWGAGLRGMFHVVEFAGRRC
jgi:hypothetical protein